MIGAHAENVDKSAEGGPRFHKITLMLPVAAVSKGNLNDAAKRG